MQKAAPLLHPKRFPTALFLVFLIISGLIIAGAWYFYYVQKKSMIIYQYQELYAIADLKVSQIENWREERKLDAETLFNSPVFIDSVDRYLKMPGDEQLKRGILRQLESMVRYGIGNYVKIYVVDAERRVRLLTGKGRARLGSEELSYIETAMKKRNIFFSDLHTEPSGEITIEVIVPLLSSTTGKIRVVGAVVLQIDPERYLYPRIKAWPTPSLSGETLLVRRDGKDVVFLNELRHMKGTALVLRRPADDPVLPAALAVRGYQGIVDGMDYRGVPVIAATRPIAGTDWFIVSKIDKDEIIGPILKQAVYTGVLAFMMIVAAGAIIGLRWQRERVAHYSALYDSEMKRQEESKHAEEVLAESETRYRSLFENMIDGFALHQIVTDEHGKPVDYIFLECNRAFERLTGLKRDAIVGKRVTTVLPRIQDDPADWIGTYGKVANTGQSIEFEQHAIALDKWFAVSAFSARKGHFATIFIDITERKRQEHERETTVLFLKLMNESRSTQDLVRKAISFFQEESGCEAVGIRLQKGEDYPYYETSGFENEFVKRENRLCACDEDGQPFRDSSGNVVLDCMCGNVICGRFDPAKPFFTIKGSFWTNSTSTLLASTTVADRQARTRNRCNGEGYESVALIPLSLGEERFGLLQLNDRRTARFSLDSIFLWERLADYLAVALAKFQASEALRESEERYRDFFKTSQDSVFITTVEGAWMDLNDATVKMFGYSDRQELEKTSIRSLYAEPEEEAVLTALIREKEYVHEYPLRMRKKDGTLMDVLLTAVTWKAPDGSLLGYRGTMRDITVQKRIDEENKKLLAELSRSNKELEQFAYIASHDLQEPLRMIASFLQLLEQRYKGKIDKDADEFISYAVDGAVRMQRMVNDLLAYSRIGTRGKAFERVDSKALLQQAIANLKLKIEETGAKISFGRLPTVEADPVQLVQVFQNLLANSIKFRGDRISEIAVNAEEREQEWEFSVRDNGIGIDQTYKEKVFVIFQRLHTASQYPGSGIGLSICKKIIERHRGRIWFTSEPGKGTIFYFTIPRTATEAQASLPAAASSDASVSGKKTLRSSRHETNAHRNIAC